ncbi:hypothetical protein BDN70DRAFT_873318 [Pholiota conissans]|uniref:EF-hand domain-containing protein n=1 Tax=Pholiota conissans TaxID=109636 RepID=A0A9P5ZB35_9AGAR|nr:hypothetical protein BDN70DRAFT_873318 [Pholiota conissans]
MSEQGAESSTIHLLLDAQGDVTDQFEICLKHIFAKYCTPAVDRSAGGLLTPPEGAYLSDEGLREWALATNGEPFSEDTKSDVVEFFDVTDDGNLTFKGFLQVYQLQTENEEKETWKDLEAHGFNRTLTLVKS